MFDKKVFGCDAGNPVSFIEMAKRLANLYGRELGTDLVVKYTKPLNETDSMEGPQLSEPIPEYITEVKAEGVNPDINSDSIKSVFQRFMIFEEDESFPQNWKAQTRELVKLCRPEIISLSRP